MDELSEHTSSFLSLQQLLEELENFIVLESQRNGNPWSSAARLCKLFYEKHGVLPEDVAKSLGYSDSFRNLLESSKRFSIYGTQISQKFYVALLPAIVSRFPQYKTTERQQNRYRIKRPWKVDGRLVRMLKAEDAKEISKYQPQKRLELQINRIDEIKSINDLEFVLMEIIRFLMANNPIKIVTVAALSKEFLNYYNQPIITVVKKRCPDIKLIELLQTIPNLHVQKVDDGWQITIEAHSME